MYASASLRSRLWQTSTNRLKKAINLIVSDPSSRSWMLYSNNVVVHLIFERCYRSFLAFVVSSRYNLWEAIRRNSRMVSLYESIHRISFPNDCIVQWDVFRFTLDFFFFERLRCRPPYSYPDVVESSIEISSELDESELFQESHEIDKLGPEPSSSSESLSFYLVVSQL